MGFLRKREQGTVSEGRDDIHSANEKREWALEGMDLHSGWLVRCDKCWQIAPMLTPAETLHTSTLCEP